MGGVKGGGGLLAASHGEPVGSREGARLESGRRWVPFPLGHGSWLGDLGPAAIGPAHLAGLLLWGKEEDVLGVFATLRFVKIKMGNQSINKGEVAGKEVSCAGAARCLQVPIQHRGSLGASAAHNPPRPSLKGKGADRAPNRVPSPSGAGLSLSHPGCRAAGIEGSPAVLESPQQPSTPPLAAGGWGGHGSRNCQTHFRRPIEGSI